MLAIFEILIIHVYNIAIAMPSLEMFVVTFHIHSLSYIYIVKTVSIYCIVIYSYMHAVAGHGDIARCVTHAVVANSYIASYNMLYHVAI